MMDFHEYSFVVKEDGRLFKSDDGYQVSIGKSDNENIWVLRNATPYDEEATETFINLVGSDQYQNLLKDKKSIKIKVWEKIFKEMTSMGYKIASNAKEGGVKCSQKWRNLKRSYLQFIQHVKTTGKDTKLPPKHYDLLHNIFTNKHKINPIAVLDTMKVCSTNKKHNLKVSTESTNTHIISTNNLLSTSSNLPSTPNNLQPASNLHLSTLNIQLESTNPQPSTSSDHTHNNLSNSNPPNNESITQLKMGKYSARPSKVTCNDIFNLIKTDVKAQEQSFNKLCDLLRKQNEQRERLTDTLVKFFNNTSTDNNNKRKKYPSDSE